MPRPEGRDLTDSEQDHLGFDTVQPDHKVETGFGPEHATELHIYYAGDVTIVVPVGEAFNADAWAYDEARVDPAEVLSRYKRDVQEPALFWVSCTHHPGPNDNYLISGDLITGLTRLSDHLRNVTDEETSLNTFFSSMSVENLVLCNDNRWREAYKSDSEGFSLEDARVNEIAQDLFYLE
jgi:hypothetical protein